LQTGFTLRHQDTFAFHALTRAAAVGVAVSVAASPVLAKTSANGPAEPRRASTASQGPYIAVVSINHQRVNVYNKDGLVTSSPISSGQRGRDTPQGVFSIIAKEVEHKSTLYNDAEMPYMQRITWSGVAMHAGNLPGYPASHGCIRLPFDFARSLFRLTPMHTRVVVGPGDAPPAPISHSTLFQPRMVAPPMVENTAVKSDTAPPNMSSVEAARALKALTSQQAVAAVKAASDARVAAAASVIEARKADFDARKAEDLRRRADLRAKQTERFATRSDAAREAHQAALADLATETVLVQKAQELSGLLAAQVKTAQADAEAKAQASVKADTTAREAARLVEPVAVLVSRATGRVYIRQAQQPVLDMPVTIKNPDQPIGTQVFTALSSSDNGAKFSWNVLNVASTQPEPVPVKVKGKLVIANQAGASAHDQGAQALDRIEFPPEVLERVTPYLQIGSSLIVSDFGPSFETGRGTDIVVQTKGEEKAQESVRRLVAERRGGRHR
jgi:hypothetical protein